MPKTLMPNPRLSYVFLLYFIFKLSIIYGPTSDFCSVCELQVERGFLDAFFWIRGWKCIKLAGTSRRPNVAMSPGRDVPTSRRWVNKCRSQRAATSRYLNVVTSQRHDVATSRSQRDSCLSIIKSKKGTRIRGIEDRTN